MSNKKIHLALLLLPLLLTLLAGCGSRRSAVEKEVRKAYESDYRAPAKEVRAAWLPTVWRTQYAGMTPEEQRHYLWDRVREMADAGVNVIYFQVRSEADAWYPSPYEPWSRFLTGTQGLAPRPLWDPLAYMIDICHDRGIELHAWINPYRAAVDGSRELALGHPARLHPEWVLRYGTQLFFDPGLPEVRDYTCRIVRDLVTRYDLDGIHLDDYFYPYPIAGEVLRDDESYRRYGAAFASKADWRRDNVTRLIRSLERTIHSIKPYVKFGISPFGIYRNARTSPDGSKTTGLQNYDDLYADILLWDREGLIDYLVPQIYWNIGNSAADYAELILWWSQHIQKAQLVVGQHAERTMEGKQLHPKMVLAAKHTAGNAIWPGEALWSEAEGVPSPLAAELKASYWSLPALLPEMPYPAGIAPLKEPERDAALLRGAGRQELVWMEDLPLRDGLETKHYVIYCHPRGLSLKKALRPENIVGHTRETRFRPLDLGGSFKVAFTITRVDRYDHETVIARDIDAVL